MHVSLGESASFLARYLRPQRRSVAGLALLLAASIALQLLNPQIIRTFLDSAQPGGVETSLLWAGAAFLALGLGQHTVAFFARYVSETIAWGTTNALRVDLARHCLRLDLPFHKRHTSGELIQRIDGDTSTLANFFSQFAIRVAGNALLIAGILVLLYLEDWRLGLGLGLYAALTLLALGLVQRVAAPRWAAERQASADLFAYLEERFSGTEDIRASGAEAHVMDRLYRVQRALLHTSVSAQMASNLTFVTARVLALFGYALALSLGAYLYTQGAASIGTAYVIVYYVSMLGAPLEEIRAQVQDFGQASASIARVRALQGIPQRVPDRGTGGQRLPAGPLAVHFAAVSFNYEPAEGEDDLPRLAPLDEDEALSAAPEPNAGTAGEAPGFALQELTFRLSPGAVLGVLGRTGSGKTTLTRLLFRLYDPTAGTIRLDGCDLRDVSLAELRRRVGMITQEVQLFEASIRDNLSFFNTQISDGQIERALHELGLWDWVRAMPDGLDTPLGSGQRGLSAGEAQLLAAVRVFLRDPGLVILDEASSHLDPATETLVERGIDRLLAGRTGIVIAHRLHTVQRATHILIVDEGRIVEFGERPVLAADPNSRFARLLRLGLEEVLA